MTDLDRPDTSAPDPVISVIIPAFNRAGTIARAVGSVQAESVRDVEVIVVDDGSTDATFETASACASPATTVIRQLNQGPGPARNAGAAIARGRYLAFLDSDDFWLPNTLEAIHRLLRDGDPAFIFLATADTTEGESFDHLSGYQGRLESVPFAGVNEAVATITTQRFASCNLVVRRDVYDELDGFTGQIRWSEDTDLFLRGAAMGPCVVMTEPTVVVHVVDREDNLTGSFAGVEAGTRFLWQRMRKGHYPVGPGGTRPRAYFLSQCAASVARQAFASGKLLVAYRWTIRGFPAVIRGRNWRWAWRLPLYPALSLLKPESFPLRWPWHPSSRVAA